MRYHLGLICGVILCIVTEPAVRRRPGDGLPRRARSSSITRFASSTSSTRRGSGSPLMRTTSRATSRRDASSREGGYEAEGAMVYYGRPTQSRAGGRERHRPRRPLDRAGRVLARKQSLKRVSAAQVAGRGADSASRSTATCGSSSSPPSRSSRSPSRSTGIAQGGFGSWRCTTTPPACTTTTRPAARQGPGRHERRRPLRQGAPSSSTTCRSRPGADVLAQWRPGLRRPNILYAEDTDGDGKADVRKSALPRLRARQPSGEVNGLA